MSIADKSYRLLLASLGSALLGLQGLAFSRAEAATLAPTRYAAGVVASDHPLASAAGAAVLKKGGNAFDAAIVTSLMLSVVRPHSTGIGGGGFMVLRDSKGRARVLDYREVAPAKAHRDMYLDSQGQPLPEISTTGYKAVAVPGLLAGLDAIHRAYGSRPLAELLQPAIDAAEKGFAVDAHLAHAMQVLHQRGARADLKALFFERGQPRQIGDLQRNPLLAQTLRTVAREGVKAFYSGAVAQKIAAAMQAEGGLITAADLQNYQPTWREPLKGSYRGYEILTMPPPSSGGTALLTVLNLLEPYALGWNSSGYGSSQHTHLLAEALKHAFSDRAHYLGDPGFVDVPTARLISKAHAAALRPQLQAAQWQTLSREQYGLKGLEAFQTPLAAPSSDGGTTHFAIMDRFGNVVSATETINTYFGAQVVIPGTGLVMNNEMDDFSKSPGVPNAFGLIGTEANAIAPGKKPLSSMTPTIVLKDGQPLLAVGASGGPRIITGTLQTLMNVIDFGMNVNEAVSAPRIHHQWVPETLYIERDMPLDVREALQRRGHTLSLGEAESAVQAVMFRDGAFSGASDPRKGGQPAGY